MPGQLTVTSTADSVITKVFTNKVNELIPLTNLQSLPITYGGGVDFPNPGYEDAYLNGQSLGTGTVFLFQSQGQSKITYYINSELIFEKKVFGSGFCRIVGPPVSEEDNVSIVLSSYIPPPVTCFTYFISLSQNDLDAASGNTDTNLNGKVVFGNLTCEFNEVETLFDMENYNSPEGYEPGIWWCINEGQYIGYYQDDVFITQGVESYFVYSDDSYPPGFFCHS